MTQVYVRSKPVPNLVDWVRFMGHMDQFFSYSRIFAFAIFSLLCRPALADALDIYAIRLIPEYEYLHFTSITSNTVVLARNSIESDPTLKHVIASGVSIDSLIPPAVGIYREYQAARAFLESIGSTNRPPLELFAGEDIDANPIAVLWSRVLLAQEGSHVDQSPPADYRALLFYGHIVYPEWPESMRTHVRQHTQADIQQIVSRQFLDQVKQLEPESFLLPYYDAHFSRHSLDMFWQFVFGYVHILHRYDPAYTTQFISDLSLLKYPVSKLLWDAELHAKLQESHRLKIEYAGPLPELLLIIKGAFAEREDFIESQIQQMAQIHHTVVAISVDESIAQDEREAALEVLRIMRADLDGQGKCDDQSPQMQETPPPAYDLVVDSPEHALMLWRYFSTLLSVTTNVEANDRVIEVLCELLQHQPNRSNK